jgi:hypothetical protein
VKDDYDIAFLDGIRNKAYEPVIGPEEATLI